MGAVKSCGGEGGGWVRWGEEEKVWFVSRELVLTVAFRGGWVGGEMAGRQKAK
jgi:hypothetical protein